VSAPRPDDLLQLDLSAASRQYAPIPVPTAAEWPRATIRLVNGWWAVKVWMFVGTPARRQSRLLAGQFSDRESAFGYARYEVGLLRFTERNRRTAGMAASLIDEVGTAMEAASRPKWEPPC
jgi:hypothetical protein